MHTRDEGASVDAMMGGDDVRCRVDVDGGKLVITTTCKMGVSNDTFPIAM